MDDFGNEKNKETNDNESEVINKDFHIEVNDLNTPNVDSADSQPVIQDVIKAPVQDIVVAEPTVSNDALNDDSMQPDPDLIGLAGEPTDVVPKVEEAFESSPEPAQNDVPVQVQQSSAPAAPVIPASDSTTFNQTPISIDGEVKPEEIKKAHKNGIKLALLISFGLLLFLVGGSVSAYTFWYSNPKKVVYDAVSNLMTADAMQMNSTTTVTVSPSSSLGGFNINKITFNTVSTNAPSQSIDLSVDVDYSGKSYTVGAKGIYMDNGDMYFRLDNILESLEQAFGSQMLTQTIKDEISNLQNKWVKFAISDMTKMSAEMAKTYQCTLDTYKSVNKNKAMQNEYVSLYEDSPFLTIDESNVQNKDGNFGYFVSIDAKKFVAYARSISNSDSMKEMQKCNTSSSDYTYETSDQEAEEAIAPMTSKLTTVIWVNQWTHSMSKIDFNFSDNQSTYGVTVDMNADIKVDNSLKVTAPEQPMSYDDWQAGINKIMQNIYSGM